MSNRRCELIFGWFHFLLCQIHDMSDSSVIPFFAVICIFGCEFA